MQFVVLLCGEPANGCHNSARVTLCQKKYLFKNVDPAGRLVYYCGQDDRYLLHAKAIPIGVFPMTTFEIQDVEYSKGLCRNSVSRTMYNFDRNSRKFRKPLAALSFPLFRINFTEGLREYTFDWSMLSLTWIILNFGLISFNWKNNPGLWLYVWINCAMHQEMDNQCQDFLRRDLWQLNPGHCIKKTV